MNIFIYLHKHIYKIGNRGLPDDAFRAGLRKFGPKMKIPEYFRTKKSINRHTYEAFTKFTHFHFMFISMHVVYMLQNIHMEIVLIGCITKVDCVFKYLDYPIFTNEKFSLEIGLCIQYHRQFIPIYISIFQVYLY